MKEFKRLWAISLVVKLILAALIPLSADEAYYWVWSHKLQLSYFDHPPMVAWIFYLGHFLEPLGHAVRWPAVILGHLTLLVGVDLIRHHISWDKTRMWVYLVLFSPLLGFGSLVVTPDLPVVFFWTLSIWCALRALRTGKAIDYLGFGAALGLGFCAKYHIVLFLPAFFLYLFFEKKWKDVRWSLAPLTILTGLIFCTPVLLWNYQNEFASFIFQFKHGLEKETYNPEWTISYLAGQLLIIFPLAAWAALRVRSIPELRWAPYFAWTPIVFFFLTSFRALVEANWPIIAYPAVLVLAVQYPRMRSWQRYYIGFFASIICLVLATLWVPQLRNLNTKVSEPYEFQNLAEETKEFQPLYASSYQMASSLWYFSKIPVFKLKDISRFDFFDTLPEAIPQSEVFYLVKRENNGLPPWLSQEQWSGQVIKKIEPDYVLMEFKKQ